MIDPCYTAARFRPISSHMVSAKSIDSMQSGLSPTLANSHKLGLAKSTVYLNEVDSRARANVIVNTSCLLIKYHAAACNYSRRWNTMQSGNRWGPATTHERRSKTISENCARECLLHILQWTVLSTSSVTLYRPLIRFTIKGLMCEQPISLLY